MEARCIWWSDCAERWVFTTLIIKNHVWTWYLKLTRNCTRISVQCVYNLVQFYFSRLGKLTFFIIWPALFIFLFFIFVLAIVSNFGFENIWYSIIKVNVVISCYNLIRNILCHFFVVLFFSLPTEKKIITNKYHLTVQCDLFQFFAGLLHIIIIIIIIIFVIMGLCVYVWRGD